MQIAITSHFSSICKLTQLVSHTLHALCAFSFYIDKLMDLPKPLPNRLRTSLTLILIFSLTFFPAISEGSASIEVHTKDLKQKELVLGSRPPRCLNKCLNCRPCMATLVISPHQRNGHKASSVQRDESYYLLSWKCKCGNKFFQP